MGCELFSPCSALLASLQPAGYSPISPLYLPYHLPQCLQVPLFDAEVRAPPGLRAMGSAMFEAGAKG